MYVERKRIQFKPDSNRVITRLFIPGGPDKVKRILNRILDMGEKEAGILLDKTLEIFEGRHRNIKDIFLNHYLRSERYLPEGIEPSMSQRLLIGSYLTLEYSIESAALFNPSIVESPDQSGLKENQKRVIMSFRATGEGHVSSIEFRSGVLDKNCDFVADEVSPYLEASRIFRNMHYEKDKFETKLNLVLQTQEPKDGQNSDVSLQCLILKDILEHLPEQFSYRELLKIVEMVRVKVNFDSPIVDSVVEKIEWIARNNYQVRFSPEMPVSERVIFPVSETECRGIEDARFVKFTDDDGSVSYYATYTAFNGSDAQTQLLETKDFLTFNISTLSGRHIQSKGMALFPRKINGRYTMIARSDGENMFYMQSSDMHLWDHAKKLQIPEYPWEFVQIGNCGSPVETEHGWLLLTHGVGAMRRYCIGATLLDLEDPSKIIGQSEEPLLEPDAFEREGYVPNVVYSCGGLLHNNRLVIPYAMSDSASSIATVNIDELVAELMKNGEKSKVLSRV